MKTLSLLFALFCAPGAFALGGNPNVRFTPVRGAFPLIAKGRAARVVIDAGDWPGVARAARDLQNDLAQVADSKGEASLKGLRILVGTLGHSPTIDALVRTGKLDVQAIRGKWEASVTQVVGNTLVVAGADKRGTIYAVYDLSESAGVSPWSWWADVPVKHHPAVYVTGRTVAKSPVVKYRGIFLNDEAPSLSNWVNANFKGYNHEFYEKVFELLLRLRANYLWPAMWNNAFSEDDTLNPKEADEYGIVMGTSHVEPMMRADKEWNRLGYSEREWNYATHPKNLEKFWTDGVNRNKPYENVVTMAMRGKVDTPMSETANISLLESIVAAQRKILAENVNPDVTQVPQLWCLYKEVQEYYEKGMRVPNDVTLLWADDNWGDIRRLPTAAERNRKGGACVYYHFDYVGGPRNYKWIDTNPIPKIWEQMNLAHHYGADRIWIVNVGDLKPMEFPLEFFLTMARDPEAMRKENLQAYTEHWAAREFGPTHAKAIASIVSETGRLNGRRKPELIAPDTYSVENYGEADRVVAEYQNLTAEAKTIGKSLPAEAQSAYSPPLVHPARAAWGVNDLYIAAAKNALYAKQGRASANVEAARVRALFAQDAAVTAEYHAVNGGKWNHFMDQTHIGYTSWQQPDANVMPKVTEVTLPDAAGLGVETAGPLDFTPYGAPTKRIEVYDTGRAPLDFTVSADAPWVRLSRSRGQTSDQTDIEVSVDRSKVPSEGGKGTITITGGAVKKTCEVTVQPSVGGARGFVEGDGVVAIEAEHASRRIAAEGVRWETIPGYGRTLSGVEPFPVEFKPFDPGRGARMEYDLTTFTSGKAALEAIVGPSLAFQPGHGLRVAFAFDDAKPQVVDVATAYLSRNWETAVSDAVKKVRTEHTLRPGRHVLKVWAVDPGVVIERLVVDLGGLKPSYLGPSESRRTP